MVCRNLSCRICLRESNTVVSIDSCLSERNNVRIQEAIEKVMSAPLIINDVYPKQICKVCLGNLRISYELWIEFKNSESILLKCFKGVDQSMDEKSQSSSAPVEVIFGSNRYDLKDLVIVEEPEATEANFSGFLNNLGRAISAKFVNKKIEIKSDQRSDAPDVSIESVKENSSKRKVKIPYLSVDNVAENKRLIIKTRSSDNSTHMEIIKDPYQFISGDQGNNEDFRETISESCINRSEGLVEQHTWALSNSEIIEIDNGSLSAMVLDTSNEENKFTLDPKNKYTNGESMLTDEYTIIAENDENKNLKLVNEVNKNDSITGKTKRRYVNEESILINQYIIEANNEANENSGRVNEVNENDFIAGGTKRKYGNRESLLIDQYIIEAKNEENKNREANNKNEDGLTASRAKRKYADEKSMSVDQFIIQADNEQSETVEIVYEVNGNDLIAVGTTKKYCIEESISMDNNISKNSDFSEFLQLQNNTANDGPRQMETSKKQPTNVLHFCEICQEKFQSKHLYNYHKLTKHSEQKYMCHFCGNKFHTKGSLTRHMLSHTDKTTVLCVCPVCGKTFHYKGGLFYHMKQHTNERNYCCSYCDRRFYTLTSKKRHQLTHTGVRPYGCNACNQKFYSSGELSKHKYMHTAERPHHCTFCGKGFTSQFNMKLHLTSHPGDFFCDVCHRGFVTKDVLKFHYRSKHKDCLEEEEGGKS